jgi:TPR repeat protein
MRKIISAFFLVLLVINVCGFANSKTGATEEFTSRVKLETCCDDILWIGLDMPNEFNPVNLNDSEKEVALEKGLAICEKEAKQGNGVYQATLAKYYYTSVKNPNIKRALYWAQKAAEQGIAEGGMTVLHNAYLAGNGVIQDVEEGLKWCFLAAAKGDKWSKEKADGLILDALTNEYTKAWVTEAKRRANKWMKEHENVFFSPD